MGSGGSFWFPAFILSSTWAVITYHAWIYGDVVGKAWRSLLNWTKAHWQVPFWIQPLRFQQQLDKLRIEHMRFVLIGGCHMMAASFALTAFAAVRDFEKLPVNLFVRLGIALIFYMVCNAMVTGVIPLTIRWIDALLGSLLLFLIYMSIEQDVTNFGLASQRGILRILASVCYMSLFKAVIWNIILSMAICFATLSQNVNACSAEYSNADCVSIGIYSEIQAFVMVMLASIGICKICEGCLRAQVEAEDAHSAVYSLLSVVCDAVVQIGTKGDICHSTPHLHHLLNADKKDILDGTLFSDYISSEADRERFTKLLCITTGSGAVPVALHLDLIRCCGPPVPVQLFCSHRSDELGQTGFLIGIRQMANLLREAEAEVPANTDLQVLTSAHLSDSGAGKRRKRSRHSRSSSASSFAKMPLPSLQSILVTFDAISDPLHISKLVLNWQGNDLPSLKDWLFGQCSTDFETWIQTYLNALNTDGECPSSNDFGPLVLNCPGGDCTLTAKAMTLEFASDDDESDGSSHSDEGLRVTLCLNDFVQCSRRESKPKLQSIHEFVASESSFQALPSAGLATDH